MQNILNFFIENTRFTLLLLIGVLFLGTVATLNLDIESNPEINQPIGVVQTFYPNSSPADVETSITKILEEEIAGLANLKDYRSNSLNNLSNITVNFESSADPKTALDNLREAVNNAASRLPSDAEIPRVIELDFNNQSIVTLSLIGDLPKLELSKIADSVSDTIKKIPGVSKTEITGDIEEVVQIVLDPVRLEAAGLSVGEVINAINTSNINAPLGSISKDYEEISLRLLGKATDIYELQNLPIKGQNIDTLTSFTRLSDLGEVKITTESIKTDSFVSSGQEYPANSVNINVYKSKGGNIINIVKSVEDQITEINKTLPEGTEIIKTNDNAFFIRKDLATLSSSGMQTMVIIFFALLIFLTTREALVAAIAVPIIFLMTFGILYFAGETLNGLTIFSLILSLGLVVDTSIVIVEGIHEYRHQGFSRVESAKKSLDTYKWPLVAGTLTTLAAFAPMLLVGGIVGAYIRTIPIVLSVTLFCSLFVSFVFTPLIGSKVLKESSGHSWKNDLINKMKLKYKDFLINLLDASKTKKLIMTVVSVLFVLALSMPITGIIKAQLFPVTDTPFIYVNIEAPVGTPLTETKNLAEPIITGFSENPYIKNYVLNLGTQIDLNNVGTASVKSNYGHFIVNLIDDETARPKSFEISEGFRKDFEQISGLKVTIQEVSAGPPTAAPIDIKIIGPDLDELKSISANIKSELERITGVVNISTDFDNSSEEVNVKLDQEIMKYYGISNQQVALIIQAYTSGIDNGKVEIAGVDYETKIHLEDSEVKMVENLDSLLVSTMSGNIPLSYLATVESNESLQFIPRIEGERSVRVSAETAEGIILAEIKPEIDAMIAAFSLPTGYSFDLGGEDEEIQESFADLFSSMFIAVLLILVILVVQFNSFRQTLMILGTIPMTVIGIFPGLALVGLPLSFPAFLGIVMLSGIVVNDAIVMIDQINKNRKEGMLLKEAIVDACSSRLVPVLLTTITTVLGLLPITITDDFWRGLGFSVIFGLLTATFLTLILIPILYLRLYKKQDQAKVSQPTPNSDTYQATDLPQFTI